jgi:2-(1,2-epoxy-1,2-dihydrophenyl)acetyl-CoA isomerase
MSTTTETEVLVERDAAILTVTLNRPDTLNSLTPAVLDGIRTAVEEAAENDEIRCIVLAGAGRAFSSGASLKEFGTMTMQEVLTQHYNPTVMAMQKIEKPILASIQGIAAGAGASLTLACDFRIWADDARMALLFTRIGLVPDAGATYTLPRIIGVARAAEMLMLGDDVHAEQALDWGLAHKVVSAADLAAETRTYAERLASLPRASGMVKRLLRKTMNLSLPEQMNLEAKMQDEAGETEDFREGVTAFMEKRPSRFSGR